MIKLIPYQFEHKVDCLKIFDDNTPQFFDPSEREDFASFLEDPQCFYFVVVDDAKQVLGCGGYYVPENSTDAGLCWGMVTQQYHKQGIGSFLLQARLDKIRESGRVKRIVMDTSQESVGFFQRFGFEIIKVTENGYGDGLSQYDLVLNL